jgi:uncharacterized membrane protein
LPNFTIVATIPASFTAGGSSTSTVTATQLNGFYSRVDLTYTVTPSSGLSVSFSPDFFQYGSGSSTVTYSSSTPGTYAVTITGTGDGIVHSKTVHVTVTAPGTPNFTVTASPTSLTIQAGKAGTSTITITPSNGFTNNVALTSTVSPAGPSSELSASNISGGTGTSTLAINVGSTVAPGTYTVTVTGTSGSLSHSAQITITVTAAPQSTAAAPAILGLDPTLFYGLVGGIIALLVIGGVTVVVRRKKP